MNNARVRGNLGVLNYPHLLDNLSGPSGLNGLSGLDGLNGLGGQ